MASLSSTRDATVTEAAQSHVLGTSQNDEGEEHDQMEEGGDQHSATTNSTLDALLRDMRTLQSKIARMEKQKALEIDSDTEDEIPEFDSKVREDIDGYPDDKTSDKIWDNWIARRRVAKDIIRKSNRLRILKQQGKLQRRHMNDPDFSDSDESDDSPKDPNVSSSDVVPGLNPCNWAEFSKHRELKNRSAIDVLIGKPIVVWRRLRAIDFPPEDRTHVASTGKVPAATPANTPLALLPDRIRINSRLILLMLAHLHRTSVTVMFPNHESVVFVKPFKMLVYFQQELRNEYKKLVALHANGANNNTSDATADAHETEVLPTTSGESESSTQAVNTDRPAVTDRPASTDRPDPNVEVQALQSELMLQHMQPLMQFLDEYIVPRQKYLESDQCNKIAFHDLWLIFKPGDEVIESDGNQAYRIVEISTRSHRAIPPWEGFEKQLPSGPTGLPPPPPPNPYVFEGDNKPFVLGCVHIDSDGVDLGPVTTRIKLESFEGEKSILDLPVYPLRLRKVSVVNVAEMADPSTVSIRNQLIERGKRFIRMSAIEHAYYSGPLYGTRDKLEGQVVIDNSLVFHSDKSKVAPELSPWVQASGQIPPFDGSSPYCTATCCIGDLVWMDRSFDLRRNSEYLEVAFPTDRIGAPSLAALKRQISAVQKSQKAGEIADDEYLIISDRVWGYILRDRKWAELDLRFVSEVNYDREEPLTAPVPGDTNITNTAFDDLVLPAGHKKVILSLVAQQFLKDEHREADIIRGKGKGLIILLHGAPGVGKTSTAEGIAEAFRRPLLQITSGK